MGTPYPKTTLAVGSANILSTAVGFPLGLRAAYLHAALAIRFDTQNIDPGIFWYLLLTSVSVLVLSLILAVYLEYLVVRRFFRAVDEWKIRHLSWRANLISYALLLAVLLTLTRRYR